MKVISWQYLLTDHQSFTWHELQKRGHLVQFVLGKTHDDNRTKQGWIDTSLESMSAQPLPVHGWWKLGREIILNNLDAVHIFSGFWANKRFLILTLFALSKGVRTMVMNESYAEVKTGYLQEENKLKSTIKVYLRPLLYKTAIFLCHMVSMKNPIRILAISQLAENQFMKAGVKKQNIFSWGYFVPKMNVILNESRHQKSIKLVYIGNLLPIKGLDLVVAALGKINNRLNPEIYLDIYGFGNSNQWISNDNSGIAYKGVIPFGHSQEVVVNYDFLILPSRHDGWGVVVNEALMQGVPVILSDSVGAKILLSKIKAGLIFLSEDVEDLTLLLRELVLKPNIQKELTKNAALIAPKILPAEAAHYLENILNFTFYGLGERPIPNWEQ